MADFTKLKTGDIKRQRCALRNFAFRMPESFNEKQVEQILKVEPG